MNELQIKAQFQAGIINSNVAELKKQLSLEMAEHKKEVYTEESKSILKAQIANLRKLKESADKYRKEMKTQCMQPYTAFEKEIKELITIIDEPIALFNKQLKEIEEVRIQRRREDVKALYSEVVAEASEYLLYDEIYSPKWDLAGTSLKKIREDMEALVTKTASDLAIIQSSTFDVAKEALKMYQAERDLTKALTFINTYEANKKKALELEEERIRADEERRQREEIDRIRAEERRRIAEEERIRREERERTEKEALLKMSEQKENPFEADDEDSLPFTQPAAVTVFYRVVATTEELEQIETALDSIGVYFERRDA